MKQLTACLFLIVLLSACAGNQKKVTVLSKGAADVNTDAKTIVATDGSGHEEKTVTVSGDKVVFKLQSPAGDASVELKDNGYYIINVKNDTIIGSYVPYNAPKQTQDVISQDMLKQRIDSLNQLIENKNVTAANRNFYILPNTAVRITDNLEAIVVTPYHQMRSIEKSGDKDPEVYRFYSIKEMRENIAKLQALTIPDKK